MLALTFYLMPTYDVAIPDDLSACMQDTAIPHGEKVDLIYIYLFYKYEGLPPNFHVPARTFWSENKVT